MARSYRHIQEYEKEILELREQGLTLREIAVTLGFTYMQLRDFSTRYNKKQIKLKADELFKMKGRLSKGNKYSTKTDKINELKNIIARKDARIKTLEIENELMRDFLSYT